MSPREALDRIAALCYKRATDVHPTRLIDDVLAVLAEVSPEPGGEEPIDGGTARQVWAVRCGACGVWLPEWNRSREEARIILREHRGEIHD